MRRSPVLPAVSGGLFSCILSFFVSSIDLCHFDKGKMGHLLAVPLFFRELPVQVLDSGFEWVMCVF